MRNTNIEWCDDSWNPMRGCSRVSQGCVNCYAEAISARFIHEGQPYEGLAKRTPAGPRWTNKVRFIPEQLLGPTRWTKPRRIFVNSMSDTFHEGFTDEEIDQVFAVMGLAYWHTFIVVTKRSDRMRRYLSDPTTPARLQVIVGRMLAERATGIAIPSSELLWPLKNVWLLVSVEDMKTANERLHDLMRTPAFVHGVSAEPLLELLTLEPWMKSWCPKCETHLPAIGKHYVGRKCGRCGTLASGLDWVVSGGEGSNHPTHTPRPWKPSWPASLQLQCERNGAAFFWKQNGDWCYFDANSPCLSRLSTGPVARVDGETYRGEHLYHWGEGNMSVRIGKKKAGRLLYGVEWMDYPKIPLEPRTEEERAAVAEAIGQ